MRAAQIDERSQPMIRGFALLLACQLIGEVVTRASGLPVPGPVIGLALLAAGAILYAYVSGPKAVAIEDTDLGVTSTALLGSLGLMFVPAGVGIVQQLPLIGGYVFAISAALLISTVLTLLVTVYVFIAVKRAISPRGELDGGA